MLAAEPTNDVALAELALTYNALGRHAEAKTTCEQLLKRTPDVGPSVYVTYGNSLDGLGQFEAAEQACRQGMKRYPDTYPLPYNLGIAQAGQRQYPAAITSFEQAVVRNPRHASSHMRLGISQLGNKARVPAILALARFLVLEPTGPRATQRLPLLGQAMTRGVTRTGANAVSMTLSLEDLRAANQKQQPADFGLPELMLGLAVARTITKDSGATTLSRFAEQFAGLCQNPASHTADRPAGFTWNYYVPCFVALKKRLRARPHLPGARHPARRANLAGRAPRRGAGFSGMVEELGVAYAGFLAAAFLGLTVVVPSVRPGLSSRNLPQLLAPAFTLLPCW